MEAAASPVAAAGPDPSSSGLDFYNFASPNGLRVAILLEGKHLLFPRPGTPAERR